MLFDISPLLSEDMKAWPGDEPFKRLQTSSMQDGHGCNLSGLQLSAHFGAHADAPLHFMADGKSIDEMPLHHYLGTCQVMSVNVEGGKEIVPANLSSKIIEPRLLLKTGTFSHSSEFSKDFAALSLEFVEELYVNGVITIGIDTPSVELFSSNNLAVHKALCEKEIAILEGLCLQDVPDGFYELIALPLKLKGFDGSPVRAILRKIEKEIGPKLETSLKQARPFVRSVRRPLTPFS